MTALGLGLGLPFVTGGGAQSLAMLKKIRTDYHEFSAYSVLSADATKWHRWYFTNRLNVGNTGAPRMLRCSLATLLVSTEIATQAENFTTGTQSQSADSTQGTSGGGRTGTFIGPATVNGVTDIIYSTTIGDSTLYTVTVTSSGRIVWRTLCNPANGGIAKIVVTDNSDVEITSGAYRVPLSGSDRTVNLRTSYSTGGILLPLASGLGAGTYKVIISVDATNPAGGRVYDGGIQTYPEILYSAEGRLGTWESRSVGSTSGVPTAILSGSVAIYAFTGTKVVWRNGVSVNAGISEVHVYDSSGVEIDSGNYDIVSNLVDNYGGVTQILGTSIASGLIYGDYYVTIEGTAGKNASSSGYRCYDYGMIAYDETTGGSVGVDAFDDLGVTTLNPETAAAATLIGTGNLEVAIKARNTTDSPGTEDFAGGTHGHESSPSALTVKIDGVAVDYDAASAGTEWVGNVITITCQSTLSFPASPNPDFSTVDYTMTIDSSGYNVRTVVNYTADAVVYEDYVTMFNVPSTEAGSEGGNVGGGFELLSLDGGATSEYNDHDNTVTSLDSRYSSIRWINDDYIATCSVFGLAQTESDWSVYSGAGAPSIVQDRSDGFVKFYNRGPTHDIAAFQEVASGHQYTAIKRYRVREA